jgi:DNA polymerase-3 subunit epsilon/DNA polymerase-3 subunit alpha (Gram-positive type)
MIKTNLEMRNRIIWYDLETTGLNPFHGQIIEISAKDNLGNTFDRLLRITEKLDPKVVEITKITDEMLLQEGGDYTQILIEFHNYISMENKKNARTFLIAHNGDGFDRMFLKTQFKTLGLRFPSSVYFLDSLYVSRMLYPKIFSHSLASLSKYFGVINRSAHRAMSDVETLEKLWSIWIVEFERQFGKNDMISVYNQIYF